MSCPKCFVCKCTNFHKHATSQNKHIVVSCTIFGRFAKVLRFPGPTWTFASKAGLAPDYMAGAEYFNYLTKANSVHNEGRTRTRARS